MCNNKKPFLESAVIWVGFIICKIHWHIGLPTASPVLSGAKRKVDGRRV
jgi:hypothetical protein